MLIGQDVEQVGDRRQHCVVLGLHLVALHARELVEAEFKDVVHLLVREDVAVPLDARLAANENAEMFRGGDGEGVGLEIRACFVAVACCRG